jgi:hypothetical protein
MTSGSSSAVCSHLDSNLGGDTDYPKIFRGFSQVMQVNASISSTDIVSLNRPKTNEKNK